MCVCVCVCVLVLYLFEVENVFFFQLLEDNNLSDAVNVLNKQCSELEEGDLSHSKIDAIVGEPFFSFSLLPWHNLHFWYVVNSLRRLMAPNCLVVPSKASLKAIAGMNPNLNLECMTLFGKSSLI